MNRFLIRCSVVIMFLFLVFHAFAYQNLKDILSIPDVSISKPFFSPSRGEEVNILYKLTQDAKVTIKIYDPDFGVIRNLIVNKKCKKGINKGVWDGRDDDNTMVPDEAYFFTIEAKNKKQSIAYDPTTFSGGEELFVPISNFNREAGTLNFVLKKQTRILFRVGIKNGPLLRTLVDWKPQPKGENTVYWNCLDETDKIDIASQPDFSMMIAGFELPENSIITYGNKTMDYFGYKEKRKTKEKKEKNTHLRENVTLSKHYFMERIMDRSPKVHIKFPHIKEEKEKLLELSGRVIIQVDLGEEDKKYFTYNQFEIIFSVDGQYFMEETNGYVPYNWVWDTNQFSDGEHFLTVNVASLKNQIGASSVKVIINNKNDLR